MKGKQFAYVGVVLACLAALTSCTQSVDAPPSGGQATLQLTADLSGMTVATLVVEVSAPDIPTTLVFNIPITNGVASGTITVPAGSDRTFTLRAFDAHGVEIQIGSAMVSIQAGANPAISIVLSPLTGDVPIHATLGSLSVTVSAAPILEPGETATLTALIKDQDGNPVTGTVAWATRDPWVASVNASGLVTTIAPGIARISATFQGVTGVAAVTVVP